MAKTVTLDAAEYEQLWVAATSWWRFWETDHLADLLDRETYRRIRAASHNLSGAATWSATGPAFKELQRRRRLISMLPCGVCNGDVVVEHPMPQWQYDRLPDISWVRCAEHIDMKDLRTAA